MNYQKPKWGPGIPADKFISLVERKVEKQLMWTSISVFQIDILIFCAQVVADIQNLKHLRAGLL